jgi:hypothetical protein
MNVDSITGATISVASGLPGHFSLTTGAVTDTALTSAVPISSLRAASWTGGGSITAPSISSLVVPGAFDPALSLTANGRGSTLASARTGAVGGTWDIPGPIASVIAGSDDGTWAPQLGNITSLTIRSGGLSSALTAGAINSLSITGDLTGNVTAGSAKSIRVNGSINGSDVEISGALGQLNISGVLENNADLIVGGNITSITAEAMDASTISAGSSGGTFANVASGNLGTATIGSIRLTGRPADGDEFANSSIWADHITSASLGSVTTDNSTVNFGLAVNTINSFTGIFSGNTLRANKNALVNNSVLTGLLTQDGVTFGDFEILIGV